MARWSTERLSKYAGQGDWVRKGYGRNTSSRSMTQERSLLLNTRWQLAHLKVRCVEMPFIFSRTQPFRGTGVRWPCNPHHSQDTECFYHPALSCSRLTLPHFLVTTDLFPVRMLWPFPENHVNGVIQSTAF